MSLSRLIPLIALAGCTTSSPPPTTMIGGQPVADAVWTAGPNGVGPGWTGQAAVVMLSTEPGLCARASQNAVLPGEKLMTLAAFDVAGKTTTVPSTPGSYTIPIESETYPKMAGMGQTFVDVHCVRTGDGARAGVIDITKLDGNAFTGSFDVSLVIGDSPLTGTFSATTCPGLAAALADTAPSCQPM
jgi:hypothetical protein